MSTFPIRTVVVLVQENRSFDHIIGWMKSLNPEINGVTGSESNPISTSNPNSDFIYFGDRSENVDPDPGHSFQAIYVQVFGEEFSINSSIDEWICAAGGEDSERNVGDSDEYGFRPDALPVYKELVSEFAVFDRWFALVPAYTQPNWLFMHSATSHGATSNDIEKLMEGYPQKTIFDSLDEDGFSFGIYYKLLPPTLFIQVARGESSHFIFEGPPGVGKRTMAMAFLRGVFGPENLETRDEMKEFELKGEAVARIEVKVKLSPQHIELNLPDLYGYEQHILIELLIDNSNCQAIVLHKADKLSADAQHYIRWIVERYKSCSKIFFCCSDVSKLQPIKSICTLIELLPPSNHEIIEVLDYIAEQESIELPSGLAERITKKSKQNLRQAIRSFEASWKLSYSFKEDQVILTGWEDDIANTAKNIIKEQSPKQLYIIRGKLQNLIEHNVSPEFIFDVLVEELKKHLDDYFKPKVDALYLEYNDSRFPLEDDKSLPQRGQEQPGKRHNDPIRKNANDFMKIEEFIAKFMSLYKTRVKNYGGSNSPEK